jgi:hypothetical protein
LENAGKFKKNVRDTAATITHHKKYGSPKEKLNIQDYIHHEGQ